MNVYAKEEVRSYVVKEQRKVPNKEVVREEMAERKVASGLEDTLVKLLKVQTAPSVEIDSFSGDPLEYNYFMASFKEAVEQKVEDPRGN